MTDDETFELKKIKKSAVGAALKKAEHYRLLNDPSPAESICLDILEVDPDNQKAMVVLILSRIDQIPRGEITVPQVLKRLKDLKDPYQQAYYTGILYERHGWALMRGGMSSAFAYDAFREGMQWYERAEELCPDQNDEARLRWNTCARVIMRRGLRVRADDDTPAMLE